MIGAIIGAGLGLAGSILGRKQQNDDQREMMELQAKLNQQQAQHNQGLAKDMWNYTSYPNQVRNMEAAGLNPALLYGMGGQGGSTAGAGQASGVGLSDVGASTSENFGCLYCWSVGAGCQRHPTLTVRTDFQESSAISTLQEACTTGSLRTSTSRQWCRQVLYEAGD